MKKRVYVSPRCKCLHVEAEPLLGGSGTITVNQNQTEVFNGSFNAKSYQYGSVWDEEPTDDGFE